MQLVKYTQACVRIEDNGNVLVFDPGIFSEPDIALQGASAVLITHEDPDHVDLAAVTRAARADTQLRVWAPPHVARELASLEDRVETAHPGQKFEAAGFAIETLGGQHTQIHSSIPVVENVGYLLNGSIYHPGDAFVIPERAVETLLLPIDAPWARMADVMDFAAAVRAPFAVPIHEYLLSSFGMDFVVKHVTDYAASYGTEVRRLASAERMTL